MRARVEREGRGADEEAGRGAAATAAALVMRVSHARECSKRRLPTTDQLRSFRFVLQLLRTPATRLEPSAGRRERKSGGQRG